MIKRSEIKVIWEDINIFKARQFIAFNNANYLHPPRKINSIYFDNNKTQMFYDSIEGIVPRKKIRIRYYGDLKKSDYFLEKKTTLEDYREKISKRISNNLEMHYLQIDDHYGLCEKKIVVSFDREYFILNQTRITLDYNITFFNFDNPNIKKPIKRIIIEFKSFNFDENINLVNHLGLKTSRFSKYTEAMENLNYIK